MPSHHNCEAHFAGCLLSARTRNIVNAPANSIVALGFILALFGLQGGETHAGNRVEKRSMD